MNHRGFTLIELLIVIAVIAILAAALVPNLLKARVQANDQATKLYIREVVIGVELRRELPTNILPPAMPCSDLAGKPFDPNSVNRCKYEPGTEGTYTVTAESKSGKVYQYDGEGTKLVASY